MESAEPPLRLVDEPVVEAADPLDAESRTAELPHPGLVVTAAPQMSDRLVPGPGFGGWADKAGGVLLRNVVLFVLIALLAALPTHFFVGRVDDTLIAAPALSDVIGGFGLLLLPLMWLAYFAVSALPLLIVLAGAVGVAVPAAADGARPRLRTVWSLVADRLRPLWLWLALFGLVAQGLPLLDSQPDVAGSVAEPLRIILVLASSAVLTVAGMVGCVVLIEHGRGPSRALHLLAGTPPAGVAGLAVASLAFILLPRLADAVGGSVAQTATGVASGVFWAVAALVTYAQARRAEGPVTSVSLRAELAAPELF
ncbi:hypothetical protein ACIA5C_26235 [Actinoplanes sp. NPDC051343]|jgi:hypothetical protein|uniref:hypothetical protein n=1 Tax=Actinoplanes sp. NPDC051343 TaxID=3363906 RepID=UPI003787EF43